MYSSGIKQEDFLSHLEFLPGNVFIVPGFCLFVVNAGIFIGFVPEFVEFTELLQSLLTG